jgi:hypothetical protein
LPLNLSQRPVFAAAVISGTRNTHSRFQI